METEWEKLYRESRRNGGPIEPAPVPVLRRAPVPEGQIPGSVTIARPISIRDDEKSKA